MIGLIGDIALFVGGQVILEPAINSRVFVGDVYTFLKPALLFLDLAPEIALSLGPDGVPLTLIGKGFAEISV